MPYINAYSPMKYIDTCVVEDNVPDLSFSSKRINEDDIVVSKLGTRLKLSLHRATVQGREVEDIQFS